MNAAAAQWAEIAETIDTETWFVDGVAAPPLVLGSCARVVDGRVVGELLDKDATRRKFRELLEPGRIIVGANLPFDLLVMAVDAARHTGEDLFPLIFAKYDRSEIFDILVAEALHAVARGHCGYHPSGGAMRNAEGKNSTHYSLFSTVLFNLGRETKLNDEYRKRYREFDGVPLDQLPEAARLYPIDDAVDTHEAALCQVGWLERPEGAPNGSGRWPHRNLVDHARHARAHWIMHLGGAWGFATDEMSIDELEARARELRAADMPRWLAMGLVERRKRCKSDCPNKVVGAPPCEACEFKGCEAPTMEAVARAYGATAPCPVCGGTCDQCGGTGRARGARDKCVAHDEIACFDCATDGLEFKGRGKKCPNCKGDRPPCGPCAKTGVDLGSARVPLTQCQDCGSFGPHACEAKSGLECKWCGEHGPHECVVDGVRRWPGWRGQVTKGRDALAESGDDDLIDRAASLENEKILTTYGPFLRGGVDGALTLYGNPVLANLRTSYAGVIQLLPRQGGVRDCVVARVGRLFSSTDYPQLELYTHAQSCLWHPEIGWSDLADALNGEIEVHVKLASAMLGISYEEGLRRHKAKDPIFKLIRQAAKPGNYGFPGGMSAVTMVLTQRRQGPDTPCATGPHWIDVKGERVRGYKGLRFCVLVRGRERCGTDRVTQWGRRDIPPTCRECIEVAEDIRVAWLDSFRENRLYLGIGRPGVVPRHLDRTDVARLWKCGVDRGGLDYSSLANTWFSSLAAVGAKDALWHVGRECYIPGTVLYGTRPVTFQHDEIVASHPEDVAPEAADRVAEIMETRMKEYIPDVAEHFHVEAALMRKWYKEAEPVRGDDGRLKVWEPRAA